MTVTRAIRLLTILASCPLLAQCQPQTTSSPQLIVNSRAISGKLVELDGKHFVAIEDLAEAFGGTITFGDGTLRLTFAEAPPNNAPLIQTGTIKGTLTYFFNANYGDKPDVGSDVYLFSGHIEIGPNEDPTFHLIMKDDPKYQKVVQETVADGSGHFELTNIPPGKYTLLLRSKHVVGAFALSLKTAMQPRDMSGRIVLQDVEIKPGDVLDESAHFGVTAF